MLQILYDIHILGLEMTFLLGTCYCTSLVPQASLGGEDEPSNEPSYQKMMVEMTGE
jgi:hypothetical protein